MKKTLIIKKLILALHCLLHSEEDQNYPNLEMKINVIETGDVLNAQKFASKNPQGNASLAKYLKLMYWMGYLPLEWIDEEISQATFRVSNCKTVWILIADFIIGSSIMIYFPIWHRLNMGEEFDLKQLLNPDYFKNVFGSTTIAFCNLQFLTMPLMGFWTYALLGMY